MKEDVDAMLKGFNLIRFDLNELPMHMLTQVQLEASEEIRDWEVTVHDQLEWSRQQVEITEAELQRLKMEKEAIIQDKTIAFEYK